MKTTILLSAVALAALLPSCVPMMPPAPMELPCMVQGGPPQEFDPGFQGNQGYDPRFRGRYNRYDQGFYQPGPPKPIGINPQTGVNYYGDAAASVVDPRRCWGPPPIRHYGE